MYNILMIGDSNLFHEATTTSWMWSWFVTQQESIASLIVNKFPDPLLVSRLQPDIPHHVLLPHAEQPLLYPLYSTRVGHSDLTRLNSIKRAMDCIHPDSIAVVWIGQHDTWRLSTDMQSNLNDKLAKIKDLATTFSEILNVLEFELVMFVRYIDHSDMSASPVYKELNDVMLATLLQQTKNSRLINTNDVTDNDFEDTTHVKPEAKRAIADSIMNEIARVLFDHLGLDPWGL